MKMKRRNERNGMGGYEVRKGMVISVGLMKTKQLDL